MKCFYIFPIFVICSLMGCSQPHPSIGGVDVGNPTLEAVRSNYDSAYGYSIKYSPVLALASDGDGSIRLTESSGKGLKIQVLEKNAAPDLFEERRQSLDSELGAEGFRSSRGPDRSIIWEREVRVESDMTTQRIYLTPHTRVVKIEANEKSSAVLSALNTIRFDLKSPVLESILRIDMSPSNYFRFRCVIRSLVDGEKPSMTFLLKDLHSSNSAKIKLVGNHVSNDLYEFVVKRADIPFSVYSIDMIVVRDQSMNAQYLWNRSGGSFYEEQRGSALELFEDIVGRNWRQTKIEVLKSDE